MCEHWRPPDPVLGKVLSTHTNSRWVSTSCRSCRLGYLGGGSSETRSETTALGFRHAATGRNCGDYLGISIENLSGFPAVKVGVYTWRCRPLNPPTDAASSKRSFANTPAPSYLSACLLLGASSRLLCFVSVLETIFRMSIRSHGAFTHQTLGEGSAGRLW